LSCWIGRRKRKFPREKQGRNPRKGGFVPQSWESSGGTYGIEEDGALLKRREERVQDLDIP